MTDPTRDAAHVLIDAAVAYQYGAPLAVDSPMNVAMRRLNDINAVTVTHDRAGNVTNVDVSPVVNGAIVSIYMLAYWLAEARGVDIEIVFAELREAHDLPDD